MTWLRAISGDGGKKKMQAVFVLTCILLEILFIWRAFRGFNTADEMYIIGTSERIFRGERILIDEWNPTQQLCTFLIHPLYCLLRTVLGSTEGIVMAFRLSYLAFHLIVTAVCFLKLKDRGWGAYWAVLLFFLYAPFGIYTLSYNSLQFSVLPLLLICLYSKREHKNAEYIIFGILAAVVVLANPFALLFYAGYGLVCLCASVYAVRSGRAIPEELRLKSWLIMSLGAAALAVIFAAFVLSRGSLQEIMANLPHILADPEHDQGLAAYWTRTIRYFHLCFKNYKGLIAGMGVIFLCVLADRKRLAHRSVYLVLGAACTIPYLFYYAFIFEHITVNYQMMPLAFSGLLAYVLTEHRDRRLLGCWYLPALLFTMIVQYATNTGIVTISAAYSVCSMAAVLMLGDCLREMTAETEGRAAKRLAAAVLLAMLGLQFLGTFYLRMTFAWGDDKVWRLNSRLDRGPLKGVYTNSEMDRIYHEILEELDSLQLTAKDELLVVGVAPWVYLYTDAGCGSYSTWQVHDGSTQLVDYYALHPDKFPTVIYMQHWGQDFMDSELAVPFWEKGYEMQELRDRYAMTAPDR